MGTRGPTHTGIGMTSDRTRARMVERLRAEIRLLKMFAWKPE